MDDVSGLRDLSLQLSMLGWMGVAVLLGGMVGAERKRAHRAAGTRTHMLVAGASCLITQIGAHAALDAGLGDPTRGLHAVITGIGFVGAGAILTPVGSRRPSGLTTASSVMFVAAIGGAVALGFGLLAAGATLMTLLTLRGVKAVEAWFGIDDDDDDDAEDPILEPGE